VKTRLIHICLILMIAILAMGRPAFATYINYCPQHYSGIDTVYWNTKSAVPAAIVGTEWSAVEKDIEKTLQGVIVRHSKVSLVKTTESAEQILAAHPKSIYLTVVFSYAPKESFTTPLQDDAFVTWLETTRNETGEDQKVAAPFRKVSRSLLLLADRIPPRLGNMFLSSASPFFNGTSQLLTTFGCEVLKYSSDNICVAPPDPGKLVVPQTEPPCVNKPSSQLKREDRTSQH
jgi:hypothetical protein